MNPDTDLCVRLYVDGHLVDEAWIDVSRPNADKLMEAASQRHLAIALRANEEGKKWVVETYDPGRPADKAYTRFGTDARGMVEPSERTTIEEAVTEAERQFRKNAGIDDD